MTEGPLLVCRDLACGYEGRPVLEGVNVSVGSREVIAVLGGSGSGKSTLLRTVGGLLAPIGGTVELFGEDLYAVDPGRRSRLLQLTGMLFQHDALFGSLTVLDNVMLPLRELTDAPEEIAREVARVKLALVDLAELEGRLPSEISGGQRKRAALARAAVLDPQLLFCDEPTAGLDPVTAARIDGALLRLRDVLGVAIMAVTHDVASIRGIADRALVVGGGTVMAEGSVDELERRPEGEVSAFFHRVPAERSPSQER